jgi:heme o synthase
MGEEEELSMSQTASLSPSFSTAEPGDFWALLKPRVMSLVVFTALVGMVVAGSKVPPVIAAASLLAIAVGAGASGALNMWWDADIDALMRRTQSRPIPAGRVTPEEAFGFGLCLSVGSVLFLGLIANWLSAGLLAFTIFFYVVIYSMWLKRSTAQNIVIGGAAGAFPPMVGEAAVTGHLSLDGAVLFLIIFLWTPPHFWALALIKAADYEKAGIPMMPNVAGDASTKKQILIYSLLLVPFATLPAFVGFGGIGYLFASILMGLGMVTLSFQLWRELDPDKSRKISGRLFGFSILYLFILFAVLLLENGFHLLWPVLRFGS